MFNVQQIAIMQTQTTADWHSEPFSNEFELEVAIACQQHRYNYDLWHEEDIARSVDVSDSQIAQVKRNIDRLNQQRNDWIEKLDDHLSNLITQQGIEPKDNAPQNSETPGSIIDRMSIMALRIYHLEEQLQRTDVEAAHMEKVSNRLAICKLQRSDLQTCLEQLLAAIQAGSKRHRTYRQFKMYNDPTMNPYLYKNRLKQAS